MARTIIEPLISEFNKKSTATLREENEARKQNKVKQTWRSLVKTSCIKGKRHIAPSISKGAVFFRI